MITTLFSFLLLLLSACTPGGTDAPPQKQVAVTFDDAPVMRFYSYPSQWHRLQVVDSLTSTLHRYGVPTTVFAVGTLVESPEGRELMQRWMAAGAHVGNHSMTHRSFNELRDAVGREEIEQTNALLAPFAEAYGRPVRYFRFPFLAEGATEAQKSTWAAYLRAAGLQNARVTISNNDWKYDAAYTEAELAEDWERRYEIGQAYMAHMREAISFWDSVAVDLTGRDIRHVLLLHANRINRDYLPQILDELRRRGFSFISLEEAYADPVYDEQDEWVSENGTSFLENIKQTRLKYTSPLDGAPPGAEE